MTNDKSQQDIDMPFGQVIELIEQIQYQEGAIATKIILDKATGTCRLVALDEGQGRSEHAVPFDALVYLLDGEAEVTISGKPLHLRQGEIVIIPANEPHALRAMTRLKVILVMIKF